MSLTTRLKLCALIIVVSVAYAVLVVHDPQIASAVSSFYVAMVLTVFVLTNVWKQS